MSIYITNVLDNVGDYFNFRKLYSALSQQLAEYSKHRKSASRQVQSEHLDPAAE